MHRREMGTFILNEAKQLDPTFTLVEVNIVQHVAQPLSRTIKSIRLVCHMVGENIVPYSMRCYCWFGLKGINGVLESRANPLCAEKLVSWVSIAWCMFQLSQTFQRLVSPHRVSTARIDDCLKNFRTLLSLLLLFVVT